VRSTVLEHSRVLVSWFQKEVRFKVLPVAMRERRRCSHVAATCHKFSIRCEDDMSAFALDSFVPGMCMYRYVCVDIYV